MAHSFWVICRNVSSTFVELICTKMAVGKLWSVICFKIMIRYTCGFPTYTCSHSCYTIYVLFIATYWLAFFPALWGFYSQVYDHFLTNADIYAHKKAHIIYAWQTSMWYMGSQKVVVYEAPNYTASKKPLHVRKTDTWENWFLRDILCKLNENELDNHENHN